MKVKTYKKEEERINTRVIIMNDNKMKKTHAFYEELKYLHGMLQR